VVIGVATKYLPVPKTDKRDKLAYAIKENQGWKCKWCDCSIESGGHIYYKDCNCKDCRTGNMIALCTQCYEEAKRINDDNLSYLGILFR
jgi:hypothetical protein